VIDILAVATDGFQEEGGVPTGVTFSLRVASEGFQPLASEAAAAAPGAPSAASGGGGVSAPRLVPETEEELAVDLEDRVLAAAYGTILSDGDGAVALAALFALILEGDD